MITAQAINRRDRWADWAVVAVVIVALVAGLILRETTLSRTVSYSLVAAGVSVSCPAGWVRELGSDPLLRARDPLGGAFDTVLELRSRPLADEVEPVVMLDTLAVERAAEVAAYSTLNTTDVVVGERTATKRSFTYVDEDPNPYVDRLPVVVKGVDLVLRGEGRVIIATLLADADDFDAEYGYFRAFVESLEFE